MVICESYILVRFHIKTDIIHIKLTIYFIFLLFYKFFIILMYLKIAINFCLSSRSHPSLFINTLRTVKVFLRFLSFYINIICVLHQSDRRYNFHFSLKLVTLKTRKFTFYIFIFLLTFSISFSTPFLYARARRAARTRKKIKKKMKGKHEIHIFFNYIKNILHRN